MNLEQIAVLIVTGVIAVLLAVAVFSSGSNDDPGGAQNPALAHSAGATGSVDDLREHAKQKRKSRRGRVDLEKARRGGYKTINQKKKQAGTNGGEKKASPTKPRYKTVTIRPGDSLGKIARREYGNSDLYTRILAANKGLDPLRLKVGSEIRVPLPRAKSSSGKEEKKNTAKKKGPLGKNTHVVAAGETLSAIAKKHYATTTRWRDIFEANRALIGSPERLRPGMVIAIPE